MRRDVDIPYASRHDCGPERFTSTWPPSHVDIFTRYLDVMSRANTTQQNTFGHFFHTVLACFSFIAIAACTVAIEILAAAYDGNVVATLWRSIAGVAIALTFAFVLALPASRYLDRFDDIYISWRSSVAAIALGTIIALPVVINKVVR